LKRKADKWYACVSIQCDVSVPPERSEGSGPHGHPIGVDIGLEKFLATSDGVIVKPPKFFYSLQSKLKLLQLGSQGKRSGQKITKSNGLRR
jgi:putative transposase